MPHSPTDMVSIIRDFAQELQIQVVTLDYEVLIHLFTADALTCNQLLDRFSGSQTKLQQVIDNLEARGLIHRETHPDDRRIRLCRLSEGARQTLGSLYAEMPDWFHRKLDAGEPTHGVMAHFSKRLRAATGLIHSTCEYEILLNLYDAGDQSASMLFAQSNYSSTAFYTSLSRLKKGGMLAAAPDAQDKRLLRYRLVPQVEAFLNHQHSEMQKWLMPQLMDRLTGSTQENPGPMQSIRPGKGKGR